MSADNTSTELGIRPTELSTQQLKSFEQLASQAVSPVTKLQIGEEKYIFQEVENSDGEVTNYIIEVSRKQDNSRQVSVRTSLGKNNYKDERLQVTQRGDQTRTTISQGALPKLEISYATGQKPAVKGFPTSTDVRSMEAYLKVAARTATSAVAAKTGTISPRISV
jgi:SRSO17 transposase